MKRIKIILVCFLLCLAGLSLQAQDRWIYSAELHFRHKTVGYILPS